MRSLLKNKHFYIYSCIILLLGIAIGIPFNIDGFSFNLKIELFDIISLIASIFLAIYVVSALERRVQDDRIEKELHIEQINQVEHILNELENLLLCENVTYNNINSRISKIRIKKNNIFRAFNECLSKESHSLIDTTNKISQRIDTLKRLLTDTSVNKRNDVVMKGGVIKYSNKRVSDINNAICGLENDLYRLKITLNRI